MFLQIEFINKKLKLIEALNQSHAGQITQILEKISQQDWFTLLLNLR